MIKVQTTTGGGSHRIILARILLVLAVLVFGLSCAATESEAKTPPQAIRIGMLAKRGAERCLEKWGPTAAYLAEEIPGYSFTIVPLGYVEIQSAVRQGETDFILANASFYVTLEKLHGASRIVTLNNLRMGKGHTVFGGVIFCRSDRKDIRRLTDLKGKTFIAADERALAGWQAVWRELKERGIDPYSDFADLSFGGSHDAVVYAVRDGKVDAGAVRTDALERMAMEGSICVEDFHVFHEHGGSKVHLPFLHSTRSYPEWPMAMVRHTSDELAEKVAAALLNMSPDSEAAKAARCAGWTVPHNYQPVHECLKYLRVTPYEDYGKVTFRDIFRQYWPWLLGAVISMAIITLFALHVAGLNRKLQESMAGQRRELAERKRTEKKLRQSEAKYRMLVNCLPAITYVAALNESSTTVYISPQVETLLGCTQEEYRADPDIWAKRLHPDDRERVLSELAHSHITHEPFHSEYRMLHGDGRVVWFRDEATVVLDAGGEPSYLQGLMLDITERKKAEEKLRESEEKYRSLIGNIPSVTWTSDSEGKTTFISPNIESVYGYTAEEIYETGASLWFGRIHALDVDRVEAAYEQLLEGRGHYDVEYRIRKKNGDWIWLHDRATRTYDDQGVVRVDGVFSDITERKQAEKEISKFKAIADNASYGVAILDADGNMTYINECIARMHGYEAEELIGQNLSIFHNEEQSESVRKIIEELEKKGSFSSLEVWHEHRDGSVFPTLMNGVAIKDESGDTLFMAAMATDITEVKRLQEFAERAQRLETAGTIAGQVAHDFNNLLGPLMAYPELIKEELSENHPAAKYLDFIETAAQQIAEINMQLLTLSRRGHYNLESLNLNDIVVQTLKHTQPLPGTLVIEKNLSPDLMLIKGGGSQILRVISNLISNALDATQGIGKLTIKTQNWYVDSAAGKYVQLPIGEYVKVTVSDTGCGIEEDALQKIFEPFFTTKVTDRKRGSGLGLSVVHAVVEDHHGYIDVESTVGKGTSFYLYFSITRDEVTVAKSGSFVGGSESILVVDDDDMQRDVAVTLLKKLGYAAHAVESGEKALDVIGKDPPQLLLLDMVMPSGMDGTETYRKALQLNPSQKAVIVSGYAETERVEETLNLGAGAFIRKPLALRSIALAVRRELDSGKPVPVA